MTLLFKTLQWFSVRLCLFHSQLSNLVYNSIFVCSSLKTHVLWVRQSIGAEYLFTKRLSDA
jgi:hypothetical protein